MGVLTATSSLSYATLASLTHILREYFLTCQNYLLYPHLISQSPPANIDMNTSKEIKDIFRHSDDGNIDLEAAMGDPGVQDTLK